MKKKVLLISWNPVPLPGIHHIEGSGLRWWRLALGLSKNNNIESTLAVRSEKHSAPITKEAIEIITWADKDVVNGKLIKGFDTVIMPMSMSGYTLKIAQYINRDQQLIIDAYAPFYVEATTRSDSKKDDKENDSWYEGLVWAGNRALVKADYVLYAGDNQKHFYTGLLAGLGSLGPDHAQRPRFIYVPGAIEDAESQKGENPYLKLDISRKKLKFLWFGALYPWYDISPLIEAFSRPEIKNRAVLVIVGGSNPMYPKDNMRFNGQFQKAMELAKRLKLFNESIFFQDWVDYDQRISWFKNADAAISINKDTIENQYSWRIRVADLAGNGVPIITNGGDPLGECLINWGAAFRVQQNKVSSLVNILEHLSRNPKDIERARKQVSLHRDDLHIYKYTKELSNLIERGDRPRLSQRGVHQSIVLTRFEEADVKAKKLEGAFAQLQKEYSHQEELLTELRKNYESLPKGAKQVAVYYSQRLLQKLLRRDF